MVEGGGDPSGPVGERDCGRSRLREGYSEAGLSRVGVVVARSTSRVRIPCLFGFSSFFIADGLSCVTGVPFTYTHQGRSLG
jgi:hypothetical protein